MSKKHGKTTNVKVNAIDISVHTRNTEWKHTGDTHDITTYKEDDEDTAKEYLSGLTDGTATISGVYDTDATNGPRVVLESLLGGAAVAFAYAVEGIGTGKPLRTCNVLVSSYNETSPVADLVTWTSDLQITGMVTETSQA